MKVTYEHVVSAPVDKILEIYRDQEFHVKKLYNSGATVVEMLKYEQLPNGVIRKKLKASEPSRVPAIMRKSDVDTYVTEDELDSDKGLMTWKVTPEMMADKFFLSGSVEFHAQGNQTRMVFHTIMEVKIPLVGSKAEKIGLSKTEEEVRRQVEFLKIWLVR